MESRPQVPNGESTGGALVISRSDGPHSFTANLVGWRAEFAREAARSALGGALLRRPFSPEGSPP